MTQHTYVYGPVPSRRLGLSLGINLTPYKTCTLNCIYCQCGRTTKMTLTRQSFFPVDEILDQVRNAVQGKKIDFLTFSGEGEPTLNKDIGRLIRRLKTEFNIPVAVITNSTLLSDPKVRQQLYPADLVVPSLDAADPATFRRVNRPHPRLRLDKLIAGLKSFRRYYKGRLWLEIMLVKGINDAPEHLLKLRRLAYEIKPDRVHLNTVVRPPAEKFARPLSEDELNQILTLFGPEALIASSTVKKQRSAQQSSEKLVLAIIQNRPVTEADLVAGTGIPRAKLQTLLQHLIKTNRIKKVTFLNKTFYEPLSLLDT